MTMARAQIAAAAVVIKTALLVEAEHPGIWAEARQRVTARPTKPSAIPAPQWDRPDHSDYLSVLHQIGGTATDTEWKRECARVLGVGRRQYEYARAALLERGDVTVETGVVRGLKRVTWTANTAQNDAK